ncbi:MAG: hypothetical protein K6L75_12915 [Cellvibrionaceae bacterium]
MVRNFYNVLFLLVLVSISACNDSDSKKGNQPRADRPPEAGSLMGGDAQGVRYKTETQSGLTDGSGTFYYRRGESVTFSVGGIELGTAEGAEDISLFDFFNMEAPSTERALRKEFENTEVTDFDRVINIGLLLTFLDKDNDTSNGLDLTGWDEVLVDEQYSFENNFYSREYDFYEYLENKYDFDSSTNRRATIDYIYNNLNILIPVQAEIMFSSGEDGNFNFVRKYFVDDLGRITGYEEDSNGDGNFDYYTNESLDNKNFVTTSETKWDFDRDGIFEKRDLNFYEYDISGNVINSISEHYFSDGSSRRSEITYSYFSDNKVATSYSSVDYNNDGFLEEIYESNYSNDEKLLSKSEKSDSDQDGVYDYFLEYVASYDVEGNQLNSKETVTQLPPRETLYIINSTESSYDSYGNLLSYVETEEDRDGNVILVEEIIASYNSDGNQLEYLIKGDSNRDGERDYIYSVVTTYDQVGNKLSETKMIDSNYDGEFDRSEQVLATYDVNGNVLTHKYQVDYDLDGIYQFILEEIKTFDSNSNQLSFVGRADYDGDGVYESIVENFKTYDSQSRVLIEINKEDNDGDGSPDRIEENTKSYDSKGRTLVQTERLDWDGNGIFDRTDKTVRAYGQGNLVTQYQYFTDQDGDDNYDYLEEYLKSYDDRGNVLSSVYRTDDENDGVYDLIYETVQTYNIDRLLTSLESEDYDGDGNPEFIRLTENAFNEKGNLLLDSQKRDNDGDGVYDDIQTREYSYDEFGRQISYVDKNVQNNNLTWFSKTETIYDSFGQEVKSLFSRDRDGDGVVDFESITENTYGESGELLATNEMRLDRGVTRVYSSERKYRTLEDGLFYLYSEYVWYFAGLR